MKLAFLFFIRAFAAASALCGCYSGYAPMATKKDNGNERYASEAAFRNFALSAELYTAADDKRNNVDNKSDSLEFSLALSPVNIVTNGNNLKISGLKVSLENLARLNQTFHLSEIHLRKYIVSDSGAHKLVVDSAIRKFGAINLTRSFQYYFVCDFFIPAGQKLPRKVQANLEVNFERDGNTETMKKHILFKRFHDLHWTH